MACRKPHSRKSLLSISLLSLLVGLTNVACSDQSESASQVIEPASQPVSESKPESKPEPETTDNATKAEADPVSEIDPTDAYASEIDPADAYLMEEARTDANGNLLPELIDGLEVGMPYSVARELIIGQIWAPRIHPPVETAANPAIRSMQALGFEETRECAGTGLGLCRMEFVERDGAVLGIIVSTSDEAPAVWSWDIN